MKYYWRNMIIAEFDQLVVIEWTLVLILLMVIVGFCFVDAAFRRVVKEIRDKK